MQTLEGFIERTETCETEHDLFRVFDAASSHRKVKHADAPWTGHIWMQDLPTTSCQL